MTKSATRRSTTHSTTRIGGRLTQDESNDLEWLAEFIATGGGKHLPPWDVAAVLIADGWTNRCVCQETTPQ